MTEADAERYLGSHEQAIHAIGQVSRGRGIYEGPGVSIGGRIRIVRIESRVDPKAASCFRGRSFSAHVVSAKQLASGVWATPPAGRRKGWEGRNGGDAEVQTVRRREDRELAPMRQLPSAAYCALTCARADSIENTTSMPPRMAMFLKK